MANLSKKKVTAAGLLVALGIIYGDIGTSPLYVMSAIAGDKILSKELIYGSVSLVFWTLTLLTTIKYVWYTLKADNHGEGGIFALYSLVKPYGKYMAIPTIIGAASLLSDGLITPPISVSSAIEGLQIIPSLHNLNTLPLVLGIITLLFAFQRYGTEKIGGIFGPVMVIWFSMIGVLGLRYILIYPEIINSLNPYFGYKLLFYYPQGFWLLGAVFLCTTGAEALYSDMGHCGLENIRTSWVFVKSMLIINYLGQAAWMISKINQPLGDLNPFFEIVPDWFKIPSIAISTLAAIIASQALISGSYTLINEAISLNFWPRSKVIHTSIHKGQIYVPSINTMLFVGCMFIIIYFKKSENMEAAYGLAITLAMLSTSFLLFFFILKRLKWNSLLTTLLISIFGFIEISFFLSNIRKFPEGGYITICIALIYIAIMLTIFYGRKLKNQLTKFIEIEPYEDLFIKLKNDSTIPLEATHLVYLTKSKIEDQVEERIIKSIFSKKPKRAEMYWLVHVKRTSEPFTCSYSVKEIATKSLIKINLHLGFKTPVQIEAYLKTIIEELTKNDEFEFVQTESAYSDFNNEVDLKFVIIKNILSIENKLTFFKEVLLNSYFRLEKMGYDYAQYFGLENRDVEFEEYPLIYETEKIPHLRRIKRKSTEL